MVMVDGASTFSMIVYFTPTTITIQNFMASEDLCRGMAEGGDLDGCSRVSPSSFP